MLDRETILKEAVNRCMAEMYAKSQPKGNWFDYLGKAKRGEIGKDEPVYERHYLCSAQFEYILNKYKKAFRCVNEWKSNIDFLLDCLTNGGFTDVWVNDNSGGHRSTEKTQTLKDLLGDDKAQEVIDLIKKLQDFYRFDREDERFAATIALGASPCSNAETVKNYWKSQGVDIEIDETELSEDDYWEIDKYGHILGDDE